MESWICNNCPGQSVIGYCYECNDFFCNRCAKVRHKGHKKVVLVDLQEVLEKDQSKNQENVAKVKELYTAQLKEIESMRQTTKTAILTQVESIRAVLKQIEDSLLTYFQKVDTDFVEATERVRQVPIDCDKHLAMMTKIIATDIIVESDITPDELRDFCLMFEKLISDLQIWTDRLASEKQQIFQGFKNFQANAEKTLEPLKDIKEGISLSLLKEDPKTLQRVADERFTLLDVGKKGSIDRPSASNLVVAVLDAFQIHSRPKPEDVDAAFAKEDTLGKNMLKKAVLLNFMNSVLATIK